MVSRRNVCGMALAGLAAGLVGWVVCSDVHGDESAMGAHCYLLSIQGMTCDKCAAHVQTALVRIPGVAEARVSYPKAEAMVCTKAGIDVPAAALTDAVKKAGYNATLKR